MKRKANLTFSTLLEAMDSISREQKVPLNMEELVKRTHLSADDIQNFFQEWGHVSFNKMTQCMSLTYLKHALKKPEANLFNATMDQSIGTHSFRPDDYIRMEGMSIEEQQQGGKNLSIHYGYAESLFGDVLIASTPKGVCYLAFIQNKQDAFAELKSHFPAAIFNERVDDFQKEALAFFTKNQKHIKLHVKGTPFQLKVWAKLLEIPMGTLVTYGSIANELNSREASRAVGTAVGSNPIAYLIPCHRVITSAGTLGGYMWGTTRKSLIIGWETAAVNRYYSEYNLKALK